MPNRVREIRVTASTGGGAGTGGQIFLGLFGREFKLDTPGDNFVVFKKDEVFVIGGTQKNIVNGEINNPASLSFEDLDHFPKYLRFEPRIQSQHFELKGLLVKVTAENQAAVEFWMAAQPLWLSNYSGKFVYLKPKPKVGP